MKIRTDFSGAVPWLEPVLIWGGAGAVVLGFALTAILAVNGWQDRATLPRLRQRLAVLEKRQAKAPPTAAKIDAQDLARVGARVRAINEIPGASGSSVRAVLAVFERDLPRDSYIVSLRYQGDERSWDLVAASRTDNDLTTFLNRLEQARFTSVLLRKQTEMDGTSGARIRAEITVQE